MIEKTALSHNKIKELCLKHYNLRIKSIELLNRGSANIFILDKDKYILKEFQSDTNEISILNEINVVNYLEKHRVNVPKFIKTTSNNFYVKNEKRIIVLQKYIKGKTLDCNEGSFKQTIESAKALGLIVKKLKKIKFYLPNSDILNNFSIDKINSSISNYNNLIKKLSNEFKIEKEIILDLTKKINMLKEISKLDFNDKNKLTTLNTHGDFNVLQFVYHNKKIKAILDFVSACKMPIIWEVIRSYSYIDKEAKNGQFNVNDFDLKYGIYLYLLQILNSDFGYKQFIIDRSKTELLDFAKFRTKICCYLFDNCESITKILLKKIKIYK